MRNPPGRWVRACPTMAIATCRMCRYLRATDSTAASTLFARVMPARSCNLSNFGYSFEGVGGTSASAPAFAGIMALVNQKQATGQNPAPRQGNANYFLYALAQQQNTANLACNASTAPVAGCTFHD